MENYVKFIRGTPDAYNRLEVKNSDTLYFIAETDKKVGSLYLGDKLIASGVGSTTLKDLLDTNIENLADKQLLVYDAASSKWINSTVEDIVGLFVGATEESAGIAGLVPAPEVGKTNAFLRSDGSWVEITDSQNIISYLNEQGLEHSTILATATTPAVDDIFIIKDVIASGKYQHTAYVYNGSAWEAMDGNYSAENVYFKNDFIFTESIGTVEVPLDTGNVIVAAAGLNMKEFFAKLFAEEKDPSITYPSVGLTMSPTATSYEVGSVLTQGYTVNFSSGSYQYGPAFTGVENTGYIVKDSTGQELDTQTGTFPSVTVEDGFSYYIEASATYSDGITPITNLGNAYNDGKITAGTTSVVKSSTITGYRNSFYGSLNNKDELTSDIIRDLTKSNTALSNNSERSISVTKGALRVVFAYPATLRDLTSILDKNDSNSNIISGFSKTTMDIAGANGHAPISYKVYSIDFAKPYDADNIFIVKI